MARAVAGHRQQRLRFEVKFVIVIVLDDREAELVRELEQAQAALGTKRNGRGKLVVRRHENRAHRVAAAGVLDRVDVDPVLVEADRAGSLAPQRAEGSDGGLIGQRLDDHRVAGLDEDMRWRGRCRSGCRG